MRRIVMGLILAVCGCSDGGAGIAGFEAPGIRAGTYTGAVICGGSGFLATDVDESISETINIGDSGLLMIGGVEVFEGMVLSVDLFGVVALFEITSVVQTGNAMSYRSEGFILIDLSQGRSLLASGIINVSVIAQDFESIEFNRGWLLTVSDPSSGLQAHSFQCVGTLFR